MNDLKKIAVVIDADNMQLAKISEVLSALSARGRVIVKRAYGNWRKDALKNWGPEIKRLAIKSEQQFDYVTGKNATDMALVIDTMDLLHTGLYDAFAIISSDSDYTPLAIKLRESGVYVFGVGEKHTSESFRNACDEFLFLENFSPVVPAAPVSVTHPAPAAPAVEPVEPDKPKTDEVQPAPAKPSAPAKRETVQPDSIEELHALIRLAYDTRAENGYLNSAVLGHFLRQVKPEFDSSKYGYKTLSKLLLAFPEQYEVRRHPTGLEYKCID